MSQAHKKDSLLVFQSNRYTESRQKFTLKEKRIMQYVIAQIKPTDTDFKTYEVPVQSFMEFDRTNVDTLYRDMKAVVKGLMGKCFFSFDDKKKEIDGLPYFARLTYRNGLLSVRLNKEMQDLFLSIKRSRGGFTAYELAEFMSLSSTYAQRIYELLKQYEHHENKERIISIPDLRAMLGIEKEKHKVFANFRRKVLEVAHKHITESTTLKYEWEAIREGRRFAHIRFYNIESESSVVMPEAYSDEPKDGHELPKHIEISSEEDEEMFL